MKKFIITLFALTLFSVPALAFEADVAQFDVYIGNSRIEHRATQYPFIVHEGITYFPMTYNYVRMLGLTSIWTDGTLYLSADPLNYNFEPEPYAPEVPSLEAEVADYPVYVNGRLLDNSKEEYPVLCARGITYFPLTWRFAVREFGMSYLWNGALMLDSSSGGHDHDFILKDGRLWFGRSEYAFQGEPGAMGYHKTGESHYVLDPADRSVHKTDSTPIGDYNAGRADEKMSVEGSVLKYNGIALEDLGEYAADEAKRDEPLGIQTLATETDLGAGKLLLRADMSYKTEYPAPRVIAPRNDWFIIDEDGSFVQLDLGGKIRFEQAAYINGKRYLCLYINNGNFDDEAEGRRTFIVNDDSSLSEITDPDHGSIQLIGEAAGKPVALAVWRTEYKGVSPVNDGYFAIEEDGSLTKIYPYVFANDMAAVNGHLYLLFWRNSTVVDVCCGKEIDFSDAPEEAAPGVYWLFGPESYHGPGGPPGDVVSMRLMTTPQTVSLDSAGYEPISFQIYNRTDKTVRLKSMDLRLVIRDSEGKTVRSYLLPPFDEEYEELPPSGFLSMTLPQWDLRNSSGHLTYADTYTFSVEAPENIEYEVDGETVVTPTVWQVNNFTLELTEDRQSSAD